MKKNSVYVYGYYGSGNFGDDLLLTTVLDTLKENNYAEKYYIKNHESIDYLLDDIDVIQTNVEQHLKNKKTFLHKIKGFFNYCFEHYNILKNCHSIVFGGGTLLNAYKSSKTLLLIAFIISIAKVLKVKVYGVGLGIGKIESSSSKILVKYILKQFNYLGLRDKKSFEIAQSITDSSNIELTTDLSFGREHKLYEKTNKSKVIAISMVEAFIASDKYEFIMDMIYKTVLYCQSNGYSIKFYSFQEGSYSDSKLFQNIINKYTFKDIEIEYISILDNNLNFKFQSIDVFIGMRFHGLVLSAINNTPFIGFSTDHKVFDICDKYSMPYIDMDNISYDWLVKAISLVKNIVVDKNIKKELALLSKRNWTFLNKKERIK